MFRIFGIQLALHASFVVLVAYWAWSGFAESGWRGAAMHLALGVSFFVCVVLHELGHSLTARRYGINVPRILLLPIGGMAEMDRIPRQPRAEFLITIAGPAVNFAIALLLLPVVWPLVSFENDGVYVAVGGYWPMLVWANLIMGLFNLLPVFPMDGGRIFRAALAARLPYLQATWWAVTIGKVLALAGAGIMVYFFDNWLGAVLFVFIYFAADAEYRLTLRREQEAAYWAQLARAATPVAPDPGQPTLLSDWHGRN